MNGFKRKALTTDDLMRRQEGSLAKRRKPSPAPVLEASHPEMDEATDEGSSEEEEETDGLGGQKLFSRIKGNEDSSDEVQGHDEDDDEEHGTSEDDEEDGAPVANTDDKDAFTPLSRFSLKSKSSISSQQPQLTKQHELKTLPQKNATFASLDISPSLISALNKMAIRTPTEIQVACIPPLLSGEYLPRPSGPCRS